MPPLWPDTIAEMSGQDEKAGSNAIEPGDPANDAEGFSVPWEPSPLERAGSCLRRRVSGQDWRDAALEGAVVLLIGSAVLDVIRITVGVDPRSFGTMIEFAAVSGNYELGLLQPTLAVFVFALMRSPRLRLRSALRAVLRCVVIVLAFLSLTSVVLAVHSFATADDDSGRSLVSLLSWIVATGAVACGNLALSRTDRTIG